MTRARRLGRTLALALGHLLAQPARDVLDPVHREGQPGGRAGQLAGQGGGAGHVDAMMNSTIAVMAVALASSWLAVMPSLTV